jgi:dTMP kinase
VTGFTVLQENVRDELRGRTFAALYTVIRLCLLISLTISPLWADMWDAVSSVVFTDRAIEIGGATYALPGVRIALWGGGLIAFFAGFVSWRAVQRARKRERGRVASGVAPEPGA